MTYRNFAPRIAVLGIGSTGCNAATWLKEKETEGARILALHTDQQHLLMSKADKKILLGYEVTRGLGIGYPEMGAQATLESLDEITKAIAGSGLVVIISGLGEATGTGGAPVVAKAAREMGSLTVGVVTMPFRVAEESKTAIAGIGLKRLSEVCDAVVVIDNNRLRVIMGEVPLAQAFAIANELIATFVKNLTETITLPSLVNMDFADLRSIMLGGGICAIGVGEGSGDTKVEDAVEKALGAQLLDIADISKAEGALVHIEGGDDMTLGEVHHAGELMKRSIPPRAKVVWGARVNSAMTGSVRATVVLTGVRSPLIEALIESPPFGIILSSLGEDTIKAAEILQSKQYSAVLSNLRAISNSLREIILSEEVDPEVMEGLTMLRESINECLRLISTGLRQNTVAQVVTEARVPENLQAIGNGLKAFAEPQKWRERMLEEWGAS